MRFVAFISVLLGLALVTGSPVAGECESPTIEIEQRDVVRGAELVVNGYAFGESCYDTFLPPKGQDRLGLPITDIEIYIVQGTNETLVATGSANTFYKFAVTVVVPVELDPGVAEVQARWGERVAFSEDPTFVVSDAAPLDPAVAPVVTFVPRPSTITYPPNSAPASDPLSATTTEALVTTVVADNRARTGSSSDATLALAVAAGALVCLGVAIVIIRRRA
jgi:hypothetical protein